MEVLQRRKTRANRSSPKNIGLESARSVTRDTTSRHMRSLKASGTELQSVGQLFLIVISLLCFGCAWPGTNRAPMISDTKIAGIWSGNSVASCSRLYTRSNRCNAEQKITLWIVGSKSGLAGHYSCSYGNSVCRDGNEFGQIVAVTKTSDLTRIRVELPDGTSCLYSGIFQATAVRGAYECFAGAGVIEQGSWSASRQF
jgi:hypothetical protein